MKGQLLNIKAKKDPRRWTAIFATAQKKQEKKSGIDGGKSDGSKSGGFSPPAK